MQVNKISFGKIVKINAPYEIASQIQDIANGKASAGAIVKRQVSDLFSDIRHGEAHTFSFDKRTSYIFSGSEGNKYWEIRNNANDEFLKIRNQIPDKEKAEELIKKNRENLRENIMNLICDAATVLSVEPSYNKKMKITSLNTRV